MENLTEVQEASKVKALAEYGVGVCFKDTNGVPRRSLGEFYDIDEDGDIRIKTDDNGAAYVFCGGDWLEIIPADQYTKYMDGLIVAVPDELLQEAKEKFPLGTYFISVTGETVFHVTNDNHVRFQSKKGGIIAGSEGDLYFKGKWATVITEEEYNNFKSKSNSQQDRIVELLEKLSAVLDKPKMEPGFETEADEYLQKLFQIKLKKAKANIALEMLKDANDLLPNKIPGNIFSESLENGEHNIAMIDKILEEHLATKPVREQATA